MKTRGFHCCDGTGWQDEVITPQRPAGTYRSAAGRWSGFYVETWMLLHKCDAAISITSLLLCSQSTASPLPSPHTLYYHILHLHENKGEGCLSKQTALILVVCVWERECRNTPWNQVCHSYCVTHTHYPKHMSVLVWLDTFTQSTRGRSDTHTQRSPNLYSSGRRRKPNLFVCLWGLFENFLDSAVEKSKLLMLQRSSCSSLRCSHHWWDLNWHTQFEAPISLISSCLWFSVTSSIYHFCFLRFYLENMDEIKKKKKKHTHTHTLWDLKPE